MKYKKRADLQHIIVRLQVFFPPDGHAKTVKATPKFMINRFSFGVILCYINKLWNSN